MTVPNRMISPRYGVSQFARIKRGLEPGIHFAFFIKDENDKIKGGCSGYMFYGSLYVDLLWVDESLRGQQYGTRLMTAVEKMARDNNCNFLSVGTLDFEAPQFYKKLGFYIEFERSGYHKNSIMYFLRKELI